MNTNDPNDPESSFEEETTVSNNLQRLCESSTNYIRENPVYAICGALAAGFVVGWLLPHREPTWRERYLAGPANRVKDLFHSATESVSDGLHSAQESMGDAASSAATAMGKGLSKLKFW
jgi:hypothetical protein